MPTTRHDDTTTTADPDPDSSARRLLAHSVVRNGLATAVVTAVGLLAVYTVDDFTIGTVASLAWMRPSFCTPQMHVQPLKMEFNKRKSGKRK